MKSILGLRVSGQRSALALQWSVLATLFAAGCVSVPLGSNNQPAAPSSPSPAPPQTAESVVVNVTPANASLQAGQTQALIAVVTNDPKNQGVTWTISGSCTGTVCGVLSANASASGVAVLYSAPASLSNPETVQITATSVTDPRKSLSASIAVAPAPVTPMPLTVSVSPGSATVDVQGAQNFTAVVQNDPQNAGVAWSLSGAGCANQTCGTLSASSSASGVPVTYTAPANIPNPPTITLTATSVSNSKVVASAVITIAQGQSPVTVSVAPAKQTVVLKASQNFTATVQNDPRNKGVTWMLSGTGCSGVSCGTLSKTSSASGASITYTAPTAVPKPDTVSLTATSVTDTSVSATATITIAPPITVSVAPSNQTVLTSKSQDFTATVANDPHNAGVNWKLFGAGCSGSACGTLSATTTASGMPVKYTAPANAPNPSTVKLTATSVSDSSVSATATITVAAPAPPVTVGVSPSNQAVQVGTTQTFTATVQNDPKNNGVTWKLSGSGCSGSGCGILSSNSSASGASITYTAPASVPTPSAVTLTATSVTNSSASTSATITIYANSANAGVTISPVRGGLTVSQTLNFTAAVANDPSHQGVTWSASAGTFSNVTSSSAVYQAPSAAGVYTVTATSVANVTKSATAVIGVTDLRGVLTYHYDQTRAGVNGQEYALTTANVNSTSFAKLFSCSVDGPAYAQPLWAANLSIAGGTHNVIFAATVNDTLYAFDADANPCVTYWSKHLIPSNEVAPTYTDIGSDDIQPTVGIVGTPAIDLGSQIIYVVTKSMTQGSSCRAPGSCHQRLHAINIADGSETSNGPVELTRSITVAGTGEGSSGGRLPFDPWHENQRPGLALINNTVYLSWGSHTDQSPWHGWIIGFNKSDLRASPLLFNATPNGKGAGIWMAGGAPAVDSNNNLYVITGNGDYDGKTDFGDSFVKVSPNLSLLDWMTPFDQANMESSNGDFGAGGAAILADLPSAPVQHLIIGGGKFGSGNYGELYVLNRDAMGHLENTGTPIVQKFPVGSYVFATGAFWNNMLYIAGAGHPMKAFALNPSTAQFDPNPRSSSAMNFPGRGATPAVSSNGTSGGIVWAINSSQTGPPTNYGIGPSVLHAFDATNLGHELWNSSQVSRDQAGNAVKFTVPTVANGKVYIGTTSEIDVYGLLPN